MFSFFFHNRLIKKKYLYSKGVTTRYRRMEEIIILLVLIILTLFLPFKASQLSLPDFMKSIPDNLISICFAVIAGFVIIVTFLPKLLDKMQGKISYQFFFHLDFIIATLLIVITEFSVLNWIKETGIYIHEQFGEFVLLYSFSLVILGTLLEYLCRSKPTNWSAILITILNQIIIISYANILMLIIWDSIYIVFA